MKTGAHSLVTSPLFAGLDDAQRSATLARASARIYPAGSVLCRQGDPAEALFVVQAGEARFARTTRDGRDVLLLPLGPGHCFGLASLVPGPVHYMATASVRGEEARVLVWNGAAMREMATLFPRLSENAFRVALVYLEQIAERHAALLSESAEQRVARTITRLGATSGQVRPDGIEVRISNQDLAALSDVGMFTVSRQMKQWEREGHLVKQRQKVLIQHPEALLTE